MNHAVHYLINILKKAEYNLQNNLLVKEDTKKTKSDIESIVSSHYCQLCIKTRNNTVFIMHKLQSTNI